MKRAIVTLFSIFITWASVGFAQKPISDEQAEMIRQHEEFQKSHNSAEAKKERKRKEKEARYLKPSATIKAPAKTVKALIAEAMLGGSGNWSLFNADGFSIAFTRRTIGTSAVERWIGTAPIGRDASVRFTTVELGGTTNVSVDVNHSGRDGQLNLYIRELLGRVKSRAEGTPNP
jgi:hypothetical protein